MKNYKAYISLSLAGALLLSPIGNVIQAQEVKTEAIDQGSNNVSTFQITDEKYGIIDVKVMDKGEKVITEAHNLDGLISKTIFYKADGKIEEIDTSGAKQISYIEDFIENIESVEDIENPQNLGGHTETEDNSLIQAASYTVPSGYNFLKSEYSSAWKATGNLYKKTDVSYVQEYVYTFSKGTKISTVISVLTTIGNFNVYATLATLGISVISGLIDIYSTGKYKVRYTTDNFIVVCKNRMGLKTYQSSVDAYIFSTTNGKLSIERISSSGDTRTHSEIIHAGIYNVVALGM